LGGARGAGQGVAGSGRCKGGARRALKRPRGEVRPPRRAGHAAERAAAAAARGPGCAAAAGRPGVLVHLGEQQRGSFLGVDAHHRVQGAARLSRAALGSTGRPRGGWVRGTPPGMIAPARESQGVAVPCRARRWLVSRPLPRRTKPLNQGLQGDAHHVIICLGLYGRCDQRRRLCWHGRGNIALRGGAVARSRAACMYCTHVQHTACGPARPRMRSVSGPPAGPPGRVWTGSWMASCTHAAC
jgi:hypothetical protein